MFRCISNSIVFCVKGQSLDDGRPRNKAYMASASDGQTPICASHSFAAVCAATYFSASAAPFIKICELTTNGELE